MRNTGCQGLILVWPLTIWPDWLLTKVFVPQFLRLYKGVNNISYLWWIQKCVTRRQAAGVLLVHSLQLTPPSGLPTQRAAWPKVMPCPGSPHLMTYWGRRKYKGFVTLVQHRTTALYRFGSRAPLGVSGGCSWACVWLCSLHPTLLPSPPWHGCRPKGAS